MVGKALGGLEILYDDERDRLRQPNAQARLVGPDEYGAVEGAEWNLLCVDSELDRAR